MKEERLEREGERIGEEGERLKRRRRSRGIGTRNTYVCKAMENNYREQERQDLKTSWNVYTLAW